MSFDEEIFKVLSLRVNKFYKTISLCLKYSNRLFLTYILGGREKLFVLNKSLSPIKFRPRDPPTFKGERDILVLNKSLSPIKFRARGPSYFRVEREILLAVNNLLLSIKFIPG